MFNMIGVEFVLPPPVSPSDISAVAAAVPYRKARRDRDRDKEERKKKKRRKRKKEKMKKRKKKKMKIKCLKIYYLKKMWKNQK